MNSKTNETTAGTTNNNTSGCEIPFQGGKFPPLETPRISRLIDGNDATSKWNDEKVEQLLKLYSREYQEFTKRLLEWQKSRNQHRQESKD